MVMSFGDLVESIRILSLPADIQEKYLINIGLLSHEHVSNLQRNIDELAVQFEDSMYGVEQKVEAGEISKEALKNILSIDRKLSEMSEHGSSAVWTVEGLFHSKDWSEVRGLAIEALNELNLRLR
jgi:hypothetical protein